MSTAAPTVEEVQAQAAVELQKTEASTVEDAQAQAAVELQTTEASIVEDVQVQAAVELQKTAASTVEEVQAQAAVELQKTADSTVEVQAQAAVELQKPKKATSAYWIFTNKMRAEVTEENKQKNGGKAVMGDIAKAMSARWASLPDESKKEFEAQAEEDRQRYAKELQAYLEATDPAGFLRKKYEHLIPKKPASAYFLFSQDTAQREKALELLKAAGAETAHKNVNSKLAEMWKTVGSDVKTSFEETAKQAHSDFLAKQKEWQSTPEFAEIEKAERSQAEQQTAAAAAAKDAEAGTPVKATKRGRSAPKESTSPDKAKQKGATEAEACTPVKATKRGRSAPKESTSPDKAEQKGASDGAKRAKKATEGMSAKEKQKPVKRKAADVTTIDDAVLAKAAKLGLEGMLRNLAARPDVVACGKSSSEIFSALQASGGLVNVAKRALVGA